MEHIYYLCTCCSYAVGRNDFDFDFPLQEPLEGVVPENREFLGPDMATSQASAIWAQKSRSTLFCWNNDTARPLGLQ
jgi:hypothetical protein